MSLTEQVPRVITRRLTLRSPRVADVDRIAAIANDFDIARMTTGMPHPYNRGHAEAFVAHACLADIAYEAVFLIEHKDEGVVGALGLHPHGGLGPEIGYWIGRDYWGRGIASEAADAALTWARTGWRKRVVLSGHFADNPASGRVLEKAGFLYTGEVQKRLSSARGAIAPTRMMVWLA